MRSFLLIASIMTSAVISAKCEAQIQPSGINVMESKVTKTIDCKGQNLAVSGSDDVLDVRNCNAISVIGSRDRLSALLLRTSTIAALGDHDHIVFQDEPGFDPQVTSSGTENEIVPRMSDKDMQPSAPFKRIGSPGNSAAAK